MLIIKGHLLQEYHRDKGVTMKNNTKRIISMSVCIIFSISMLTGCQARGVCDICGKKAKLYEYTQTDSYGLFGADLMSETKTYNICEDCLNDLTSQADNKSSIFESTDYTFREKEN